MRGFFAPFPQGIIIALVISSQSPILAMMEKTDMAYQIDYDETEPRQANLPLSPRRANTEIIEYDDRKRYIALPGFLKTGLTFVSAAAIFFGVEMYAPIEYRPSSLVGTYDARTEAIVQATVGQIKMQQDAWSEQVKLVNAQNQEKYRAANQAVIQYYGASYDRAKIYATSTAQMQAQLSNAQLMLTGQTQATDRAAVANARTFGDLLNWFSPGAGDGLRSYADNKTSTLNNELLNAANSGVAISIEGWDTSLPNPSEVQAQLERIKPTPLPPMPQFTINLPNMKGE